MENINFCFDKFVEDLESREQQYSQEKIRLQNQLKNSEPQRRLSSRIREFHLNRIYFRR